MPDEVRRDHNVKIMGAELGRLYTELWDQTAWLFAKWDEFLALFATKRLRIDLMNEAAPFFFYMVQTALLDDILLHITRLTEEPGSGRKSRLSVRSLAGVENNPAAGKIAKVLKDRGEVPGLATSKNCAYRPESCSRQHTGQTAQEGQHA